MKAAPPRKELETLEVKSGPQAGQGISLNAQGYLSDSITNQFMPWTIDIDCRPEPHGWTNWSTLNTDWAGAFDPYVGDRRSDASQNAEIYWDIAIPRGFWAVEFAATIDSDRGIVSLYFNNTKFGTYDLYSGVFALVTTTWSPRLINEGPGRVRLKLKMEAKNASSSSYRGSVRHIRLRRLG